MMKKFMWLALTISIFCLVGCESNEDPIIEENTPTEPEIEEPQYLSVSDINSVWTLGDSEVYYIYFSPAGRYSFCFSNTLMGGGTYTLSENVIKLYNDYLYTEEALSVDIVDGQLKLDGEIKLFKSSVTENISLSFSKSNESAPESILGEEYSTMSSLNIYYGKTKYIVGVMSNNMIHYEWVVDNSILQVLDEEYWFYVYRGDMTYTQETTSSGTVIIYKFPFLGKNDSGSISKISSLIVTQ